MRRHHYNSTRSERTKHDCTEPVEEKVSGREVDGCWCGDSSHQPVLAWSNFLPDLLLLLILFQTIHVFQEAERKVISDQYILSVERLQRPILGSSIWTGSNVTSPTEMQEATRLRVRHIFPTLPRFKDCPFNHTFVSNEGICVMPLQSSHFHFLSFPPFLSGIQQNEDIF